MLRHWKRALQDIFNNRFLNTVTVVTISLSILIVSAFSLLFVNAGDALNQWKKGMRIMVYLQPGSGPERVSETQRRLVALAGVTEARFTSKSEAMAYLKARMPNQASLFEDLKENPLPDAFEVQMDPEIRDRGHIQDLASRIAVIAGVDGVEYGEQWFGRLSNMFQLFRFVGYALGGLFFMAAVFIVANTIRLVLYTRREEVEIMRLVGASDGFIKAPFYVEGLIHGLVGGVLGIGVLYGSFWAVSANLAREAAVGLFTIRFLPPGALGAILVFSALAGWLGSFLSLRQFFRI